MRIHLRLYRPGEGAAWRDIDLPEAEGPGGGWDGVSVSAALQYVHKETDPGLGYLLSCRRGLCNVCAMRIDGVVRTACTTAVRDGMRIEPAKPQLVLKDTIVEVSLVRKHRI